MAVRTIDSIVTNVLSESKTSAAGKRYTTHQVETADGEKIDVGFKQKYNVGNKINVDVDFKFGKWQEVGPPTGVATKPPAKAAGVDNRSPVDQRVGKTFPVPELSGEMAIIRQNALTNARELVLQSSGSTIPDTSTKAERDQFYDALVEDVIRVAYKFADFASGHRELRMSRQRAQLSDTGVDSNG